MQKALVLELQNIVAYVYVRICLRVCFYALRTKASTSSYSEGCMQLPGAYVIGLKKCQLGMYVAVVENGGPRAIYAGILGQIIRNNVRTIIPI